MINCVIRFADFCALSLFNDTTLIYYTEINCNDHNLLDEICSTLSDVEIDRIHFIFKTNVVNLIDDSMHVISQFNLGKIQKYSVILKSDYDNLQYIINHSTANLILISDYLELYSSISKGKSVVLVDKYKSDLVLYCVCVDGNILDFRTSKLSMVDSFLKTLSQTYGDAEIMNFCKSSSLPIDKSNFLESYDMNLNLSFLTVKAENKIEKISHEFSYDDSYNELAFMLLEDKTTSNNLEEPSKVAMLKKAFTTPGKTKKKGPFFKGISPKDDIEFTSSYIEPSKDKDDDIDNNIEEVIPVKKEKIFFKNTGGKPPLYAMMLNLGLVALVLVVCFSFVIRYTKGVSIPKLKASKSEAETIIKSETLDIAFLDILADKDNAKQLKNSQVLGELSGVSPECFVDEIIYNKDTAIVTMHTKSENIKSYTDSISKKFEVINNKDEGKSNIGGQDYNKYIITIAMRSL